MSPLTKKGKKIKRSMRKTYGSKDKADRVFYASINAGRINGAEKNKKKKKSR